MASGGAHLTPGGRCPSSEGHVQEQRLALLALLIAIVCGGALVSRGVGVEPHAPRIRFLCWPEITIIDLVGTGRP